MISNERLKSPTPKVLNGNESSSAPRPDADATASEDDMSVNSNDDVSLDSSPENSRVSSGVGRSYGRNSSCYTYSEVSSSRDTLVVASRGQTGPRYDTDTEEEEDESTDSASSSQFSPPAAATGRRIDGGVSRVESHLPITDGGAAVEKELDDKFSSEEVSDVPSAPPFSGAAEESEEIKPATSGVQVSEAITEDCVESKKTGHFTRTSAASESFGPSDQHPARLPNFHASARGPWHAVVSYDACVRLCLNAWAKGCMEAPMFLENECALLREAFGLKQLLLQSEEMLVKQSSQAPHEGVAPNQEKHWQNDGASISSLKPSLIKFEKIRIHFSNLSTRISSGWRALRKIHVRVPANGYVHASTQYLKQVSGLLKVGVTSLRNSSTSYDVVQETYSCRLRLKSLTEDEAIMMQPDRTWNFNSFLDSHEDDLIVEIFESKGKEFGRALVPLAKVTEVSAYSLSWESVFREPGHQLVGKIQIHFDYSASSDDNSHLKGCSVAETVAYDLVLEVALKTQWFQQRKLLLYGSWKWLLEEFASYYGISDVYTKLRYLTYVMDVATPTSDCLHLVHDLLAPVIMKGNGKATLSHQENGILNEIKNQTEQILKLVFENYKSLDESSFSGMNDVVSSATGVPAPALAPAVKVYMLLHDILSPKDQSNLCNYFQVGAKKISRMHMGETDEFVTNNNDPNFWDPSSMSSAYKKMTMVCKNVKNEIYTDIEIHNQYILPSFLDLPNLSASIYSTDLRNRLRTFLVACPPSGPSPAVAELVIATVEFQRDLSSWNIGPIQAGVDAKELFHQYVMIWIQDRRLSLLESCKLDKVQWGGVGAHRSTTPFVDEMYTRLNETIQDYQVIISSWPKCIFVLESAIADVEKAIVEALEKQYANVLSPLKENLAPKKPYVVPDELGILLNTMKRMLDVLRYNIEAQFKAWSSSCIPDGGNVAPGDRLSEVTVMLRAKFRSYLQAVVEKLVQNVIYLFFFYCFLQKATTLKKILRDSKGISSGLHCACSKESVGESDMHNLKEQLTNTLNNLHSVCATHVFIALSRGYWDRMGEIVLSFLENKRESKAWYKGPRVAVSMLDDTFAAEMQKLLGDSLREQDLEPPRSIVELRWILCKDITVNRGKSFDY
ncbi:hypothetical protein Bca52824_070341 [Brassica carinata]|uniref:Uncharacterized protein n=1 Tax=Brassica carinata TaxID=52824 RepID=A0A8X7Q5Z4_BRACI|nr:hypothetical protein Bca52824_070341 [Brassica carinata]